MQTKNKKLLIVMIMLAITYIVMKSTYVVAYSAEKNVEYTDEEKILLESARTYYNESISAFNAGYVEKDSIYSTEPVYDELPLIAGELNEKVLAGSADFLNAIRVGAGLNPVEASTEIANAAQHKAVLVRYLLGIDNPSAGHYPIQPDGVDDDFFQTAQSYMGGEVLYMTFSGHPLTVITNAIHDGFSGSTGHRYSLLSPYAERFGIGVAGQQGAIKTTGYIDNDVEVVAWPSKGVVLKETYLDGCDWTVNFYKNYQTTSQTTLSIICLNTGETWNFTPESDNYNISNNKITFSDETMEDSLVVGNVYEITIDNLSGKDTSYTYRTVYESLDGKITYTVRFWSTDSSYMEKIAEHGDVIDDLPGKQNYKDLDGKQYVAIGFTPTPPYYYISGWFTGEDGAGEEFTTSTIVTRNMNLYPKWTLKEKEDSSETNYIITASADIGGSISPSGDIDVTKGASKTFIITPDSNYEILDVFVDGISVGAVESYTFANIKDDHSINVLFKKVINSLEQRKTEIIDRWQELKPTFASDSSPYEVMPSITAPYLAGELKDTYLQDAINAINFVRFVAGLPDDVETTLEQNRKGQHGAVLLAASTFSHYPPKPNDMSDDFYQIGFDNTNSSNIAYGYNSLSNAVYNGWMDDADSGNIDRVGHRRWILNPQMKYTGFGQARNNSNYLTMYSFDRSRTETVDYEAVLWPSSPAFPKELFESDRPWSITLNPNKYKTSDLENIEITLTQNDSGESWSFSKENSDGYFNVNYSGYGVGNCIIFRPYNIIEYNGTYNVKIDGVKNLNGEDAQINYDVTFFSLNPTTSYTITATAGTGGTVSGGGTFNINDIVTLKATPNANYTFDGWYENDRRISGVGATYSFVVTANRTIEAHFAAISTQKTLTIRAGTNGTIKTGTSGNYAFGEVIAIEATPNSGYRFKNWTSSNGGTFANANNANTTFTMPANSTTVTANFESTSTGGSSGGGGGGGSSTVTKKEITIQYKTEDNNLINTQKESYTPNTVLNKNNLKLPEGYKLLDETFEYTVKDTATITVTIIELTEDEQKQENDLEFGDTIDFEDDMDFEEYEDQSLQNTEEKPFISGYPDGTFKPNSQITRAETATIIYNILNNGQPNDNIDILNNYNDIDKSNWSAKYIAFAIENKIMSGYPDNTFRPTKNITRAEMAQIIYNLATNTEALKGKLEKDVNNTKFGDISGHWAEIAINKLAANNIISGYSDGTFRSNNDITRAEGVAMFSKLLGRSTNINKSKSFSDVNEGHWAYGFIMNAV